MTDRRGGRHGNRRRDALAGNGDGRAAFLVSSVFLIALVGFVVGLYVAHARPWPYRPVADALSLAGDALTLGSLAPKHAINPIGTGAARAIWSAHQPDAVLDGHRVLTGYSPNTGAFGVWIFDASGERVHERTLDYAALDPDGPSGGSESPHAMLMLADGSAIVNVDKGDAIARYDTCGQPIWSRDGAFHHSLHRDPDGGVWTWQGEVSPYDQEQTLVRFDPRDGETLESISLFDDIIDRDTASRAVFSLSPGQTLARATGPKTVPDLFHPNDLEVLSPAMSIAFPMFKAGDLLMSFRHLDLVVVVDREDHRILWWRHGPWRRQHDPDFLPDGRISVFNNNPRRPASDIQRIDPASGALDVLPLDPAFSFFTEFMGKHETLPNGHVQIVVPYEGRVLEVDPDGSVVLEINNPHDEDHNGLVSDAAWLPPGFFERDPATWACGRAADTT